MRPFEILLALWILVAFLAMAAPKWNRKRFAVYLSVATLGIALVQLITEGYRWQMVPFYVFSAGMSIHALFRLRLQAGRNERNKLRWLRVTGIVLAALLLIPSLMLPVLLPVPHLPAPSGPFEVGTVSSVLEDRDREEVFTADTSDFRRILVRCWYPAEDIRGIREASYWDRGGITGRAYSVNAGMGKFWYTHLNRVKTNSHPDASLSSHETAYPVIIYSHAFYGLETENTMLMELLASQGYVVVSIAHTYENIVTLLNEKEAITGNLDHLFALYDAHADREEALYQAFRKTTDQETRYDLVRQILAVDEQSAQLLQIRTDDVHMVLEALQHWNRTDSRFRSRLDLNRVGILGWSFGGSTAVESCMADSTIKAGINLDGYPYGLQFAHGELMHQPFMLIQSASDDVMEDMVGRLQMERAENEKYFLVIKGAQHLNFWDFPCFFRIYKTIDFWGPIDPMRMLAIEETYVVGFFDRYLKGKEVPVLDQAAGPFPEVEIVVAGP